MFTAFPPPSPHKNHCCCDCYCQSSFNKSPPPKPYLWYTDIYIYVYWNDHKMRIQPYQKAVMWSSRIHRRSHQTLRYYLKILLILLLLFATEEYFVTYFYKSWKNYYHSVVIKPITTERTLEQRESIFSLFPWFFLLCNFAPIFFKNKLYIPHLINN